MTSLTKERVLESLKSVKIPGSKEDVVQAGMVSRLDVQEQSVFVEFGLPELNSTYEKSLRYQAQKAIQEQFGEAEVVVEFIQAQPAEPKSEAPKGPNIGTMIAIGSGKGGVGKSAVTANLAIAFQELKYRVGILDCDVYGPSIPTLFSVGSDKPVVIDKKIQPLKRYGITLMSAGFFVEDGQGLIWRGPMIHKLIQQFYYDVSWGELDVLLVDLPPGTGDAPLSLSQTMPLTGAVMVSMPPKMSVMDVQKAYSMFEQVKVPVLGMVENMTEFICPSCSHAEPIFDQGEVKKFCDNKRIPYLGQLPLDPKMRKSCDEGKPLFVSDPESSLSFSFRRLAERLQPMVRTADQVEDDLRIVL